jgi:SSS family solute:Na+ symporter
MVSRFATAKDEKTAQRASLLSGVLMAAMSLFPTLLGLAALAVKDSLPTLAANGSNAMMAVTTAHAPQFIVGLISAAIICATMSSADSNLLCMSTMVMNDLVFGNGYGKQMSEKKIIFVTRILNVIFAVIAMLICMFGVDIVTMNTFAFGIRCAGPFAAYGLGMVVKKATKNAGIWSIITGTIGFIFWQILSKGGFLYGILPVVFGCAIGVITFFVINAIELKKGVAPAPSAFLDR